MKIFNINKRIQIVCESLPTRTAFKHVAHLFVNGYEENEAKICYQNRTWERYDFESVLKRVVETSTYTSDEDKKIINKFIKNYN